MGESWKISLNSLPTIWKLVEANLQKSFSCFFSLLSQILLKHSQLLCNKLYFFVAWRVKKPSAKSISLTLTPDFLQPGSQFMLHTREHVVVPVSADELDFPLCHFLVISLQAITIVLWTFFLPTPSTVDVSHLHYVRGLAYWQITAKHPWKNLSWWVSRCRHIPM